MSEAAFQIDPPMIGFLEERLGAELLDATLSGPLREFLSRPGKQLRARLVELAWSLSGGRSALPSELPLAVELLHAGSLIVDDIEDCAEERRGRPALHLVTGLPVALNAGNWLYFAALEQLGRMPVDERRCLSALRRTHELLARCHEGQALDVGVRVSTLPQREVKGVARAIAERKTGGLAALCTSLPAICAGAPPRMEDALCSFGVSLGVGLQMLDDAGGISCEHRRAKGEEDLRNGRATWAWALLAERTQPATYRSLQQLAAQVERGAVEPGELRDPMRTLLGDAGRRSAAEHLDAALQGLRGALGPSHAFEETTAMVRAMEQSYG